MSGFGDKEDPMLRLYRGYSGTPAHPDSPAGGGGPGNFSEPGPLGLAGTSLSGLPHPDSPAGRRLTPSDIEKAVEKIVSPLPGSIGMNTLASSDAVFSVVTPPENDAQIEALDLADTARKAAYALKKAHPSIKFTSGRRSKEDQARAMASNIVNNRKWIEQTYANSTLRKKCQDWIDNNPNKKTQTEIAEGLMSVFNTVTDVDLGKFSKHLSGAAFDVQPVSTDAELIKKTIRGLTGLDKFLDTEGGLVRWHAQF